MFDYKKALFDAYKNVAEKVLPTMKESNFSKTGMLTPEEFVLAGDYLVNNYEQWSWYGCPDKKKCMNFLPKDKQALINNNISCNKNKNILLEENAEGVITITKDYNEEEEDEQSSESDCDFDLDDFEECNLVTSDESCLEPSKTLKNHRVYNISITYDNYFRTPRLWLIGFKSNGLPLSPDKIYKDISLEHTKITVTLERHPFFADMNYISVHPCKHGHVMKRLIEEELANGVTVNVLHYFIYFLKFVSTIIPNLDFDTTKF